MEVWGWVLAYVLAFTLLQLLVYRYLRQREGTNVLGTTASGKQDPNEEPGSEEPPIDHEEYGTWGEQATGPVVTDDGTVLCPRCGTENEHDPAFRYCHECISPLSG